MRLVSGSIFTDSIAAHRTGREPCLVMRPRCTVVSDSWWEGVNPAQQVNWAGPGKRCTSPISATNSRQHRPDAGDLLDRGVAGIMGQSTLRQSGEQVDLRVEGVDEPVQRGDPRLVRCGHRDFVQQQVSLDAKQVGHRHPDPALGQYGVDVGLALGSHRDQLGVPHQLPQFPRFRRRDPGVRQPTHPQQVRQIRASR